MYFCNRLGRFARMRIAKLYSIKVLYMSHIIICRIGNGFTRTRCKNTARALQVRTLDILGSTCWSIECYS